MHTSGFLAVTIIAVLAVVSPGPDFLIVTRNSILYSKRVGFFTALGIWLGHFWWVCASLIGISYLISQTVFLFNLIKFAGALYLMSLGVQALFAPKSLDSHTMKPTQRERKQLTATQAFKTGLLTNVLNPKAALFFLSFFSVVLTPATPKVIQFFYGLEVSAIALVWFSLLAYVLSTQHVQEVFGHVEQWLNRITGVTLIFFGIKLAFHER